MFRAYDGNHAPKPPYRVNQASPQAPGLLFWWPAPVGRTWRDHSIHRNGALSIDVSTPTVEPTRFGMHAMESNGGAAELSQNSGYESLDGGSVFTVSFWANSVSYEHSDAAFVISEAGNGFDAGLFIVYPYDSVSGDGCRAYWSTSIINENFSDAAVNAWNHFLFTSRSATDHEMYVNGVSVGTSTDSRTLPNPIDSIDIFHWNGGQNLNGALFDVRLYNRGMTDSEVRHVYAPQTRWDLYAPVHRVIGKAPAAGGGGGFHALPLMGVG